MATLGAHDFTSPDRTEWARADTSPRGKIKHRIHFLYLCHVISLSPFLSVSPELRYRGSVIYRVISTNIYRSLRVMATAFAIPNRALRDAQKTRDLQREQFLKEDKETAVQRESEITEHLGPMGEGECNKESDLIFNVGLLTVSKYPLLFSSAPYLGKLVREPRCPSL